jgi:hypothetical protein
MKRIKTTEVFDKGTGEVISSVTEHSFTIKSKNKGGFYLMYPEFTDNLLKIKQHTDVKVYIKLIQLVQKESNSITISEGSRKIILEELGISSSQLSTSFRNLKGSNLIEGEKGDFRLIGYPVFKGYAEQRNDLILQEAKEKTKLIEQNEF